ARATGVWKKALEEYRQPPMDPAICDALDAYVAHRREEIGAGEP
ncbi:trimethylamine methyltransferase family protein, partial [Rhizobiaceae sp. 2RAB30]